MSQVHQHISIELHRDPSHIGASHHTLFICIEPDANVAVLTALDVDSFAAVPSGIDTGNVGLHVLVHQHAPVHLQTALFQKAHIHPHADAHSNCIRSKPLAALHDGCKLSIGFLFDVIQHLAAGHSDTFIL